MMHKHEAPLLTKSLRRIFLTTGCAFGVLIFGVGGWAATSEISGAITASGKLVVREKIKDVQHLTGGIISKVHVKEGQHVSAGDILIRLDDTATRSSLAIITNSLDHLIAEKARLESERDNVPFPAAVPLLVERMGEERASELLKVEERIYDSHRTQAAGQKSQLREKISQLEQEIAGLEAQKAASVAELDLSKSEEKNLRSLFDKGYASIDRINNLSRLMIRLEGQIGQFTSSLAEARGRIAETNIELLQIDRNRQTEVAEALSDIDVRINELTEQEITAKDELRKTAIIAPSTGMVHQLAVHTTGSVITPAEELLQIVPSDRSLSVEAQVPTTEVDSLYVGQKTRLRLTAFSINTTPELIGRLSHISGDAIEDKERGIAAYRIAVEIQPDELEKLAHLDLVPGMPVEVFVETDPRTVLSYLSKPIRDQANWVFRD